MQSMIGKLNFENMSPFRKMQNKQQISGSKTQRESENENPRNYALKSARGESNSSNNVNTHSNSNNNNMSTSNFQNSSNSSSAQMNFQMQQSQQLQNSFGNSVNHHHNNSNSNLNNSNNNNNQRQFVGQNVQNILSSSTRINSMPSNVTPKKQKNNQNFDPSLPAYNNPSGQVCKTQTAHENTSPQHIYNINLNNPNNQSNSYQKYSPMILRQSLQKDRALQESSHHQNSIQNLQNSENQKGWNVSGEELKKLKGEIENYKNREIKFLVRIASIEKENKKLLELVQKMESDNKQMKIEINNFNKHKRSSTALNGRGVLDQNQKMEKGVQINVNSKSDQQVAILEEYTRLLRKKLKDIEESQAKQNLSLQKENLDANSNFSQELANKEFYSKYEQLKNKYKQTLENLFNCEKEKLELQFEIQYFKENIIDKTSTNNNPTNNQNQINLQQNNNLQINKNLSSSQDLKMLNKQNSFIYENSQTNSNNLNSSQSVSSVQKLLAMTTFLKK